MNNLCYLVFYLQITISIQAPLQLQEPMLPKIQTVENNKKQTQNIPILPEGNNFSQMQLHPALSVSTAEKNSNEHLPMSEKNTVPTDEPIATTSTLSISMSNQNSDQTQLTKLPKSTTETNSPKLELPITIPAEKKSRQMQMPMLPMQVVNNPQMQYPISLPMAERNSLQQQMMALHQLQAMQNMETVHAPSSLYLSPSEEMLLLLPNPMIQDANTQEEDSKLKEEVSNVNSNKLKLNNDKGYLDEDLDSVILEPEPELKNKRIETNKGFRKAILLVPGQRFSIGGIISSIPWLPIEVNVPDTIAWAYNGISSGIASIISIIGQRWPFKKPMVMTEDNSQVNMKMFLKMLQMRNENLMQSPVIVMPVNEVPSPPSGKTVLPMSPILLMPSYGNMQPVLPMYQQMVPGQM